MKIRSSSFPSGSGTAVKASAPKLNRSNGRRRCSFSLPLSTHILFLSPSSTQRRRKHHFSFHPHPSRWTRIKKTVYRVLERNETSCPPSPTCVHFVLVDICSTNPFIIHQKPFDRSVEIRFVFDIFRFMYNCNPIKTR